MPLGTSSDLMLGETVFAVGNAFGYENTITLGIVSALHRDVEVNDTQSYKNLIQTDAAINPGNSGGPLINVNGEIVGINVAIRAGAQKIGFAIPIDDARRVIADLMKIEYFDGTYHGLVGRDVKNANERQAGRRVGPSGQPGGIGRTQARRRHRARRRLRRQRRGRLRTGPLGSQRRAMKSRVIDQTRR